MTACTAVVSTITWPITASISLVGSIFSRIWSAVRGIFEFLSSPWVTKGEARKPVMVLPAAVPVEGADLGRISLFSALNFLAFFERRNDPDFLKKVVNGGRLNARTRVDLKSAAGMSGVRVHKYKSPGHDTLKLSGKVQGSDFATLLNGQLEAIRSNREKVVFGLIVQIGERAVSVCYEDQQFWVFDPASFVENQPANIRMAKIRTFSDLREAQRFILEPAQEDAICEIFPLARKK